ncbi:hypothetical protein ES703_55346 [subsurface metagenome]
MTVPFPHRSHALWSIIPENSEKKWSGPPLREYHVLSKFGSIIESSNAGGLSANNSNGLGVKIMISGT